MRWYSRLFRKGRAERQLDAELRFHLDQQIADYVAAGMSPEEAHRRARLEFGGFDQVKEECREASRANVIETLIQDVRYGLRVLVKNPGRHHGGAVVSRAGHRCQHRNFQPVERRRTEGAPCAACGRVGPVF